MTVIRDAVIRIRTEQVKSKLEMPDIGPAERAFQAEAKAAAEARKEMQRSTEARAEVVRIEREQSEVVHRNLTEVAKQTTEFSRTSVMAFNQSGEAFMRFGRGVAYWSASSEQDVAKLARTVVATQGAFDVIAGGTKAVTSLGVAFGPAGIAAGAAAAVVGGATLIWRAHREEIERNTRATQEFERETLKLRDERGAREREQGAAGRGLERDIMANRSETAFSGAERGRRLTSEQAFLQGRLRELDSADEARIDAEMASRPEWQRPIRGTESRRRRITERRRAEAAQPVGPEGIDAELKEQEERKAIIERQLQVERELLQLKQQELQQRRDQTIQSSQGLFGGSGTLSELSRQAANQRHENESRERERKTQESADKLVEMWEGVVREIQTITNSRM